MKWSVATWFSSGRRRAVLFRVVAVLLSLLPFVLLELLLIALGVGRASDHDDPFVGFSAIRPLFERNSAGDRYEIPRSRRSHFYPESFTVEKPANEFRVFCIGDSTVQGNPWTTETSFTTWLELSLNAADPRCRWRVVNCGGISYASYRMVPILEELTQYEPDLFIVHCSHNEFLEDRTYDSLKRTPRWLWRCQEAATRLRTFNFLRECVGGLTGSRAKMLVPDSPAQSLAQRADDVESRQAPVAKETLPEEARALLDYRGGLEFYHRDEAWTRSILTHYEFNLRRMTRIASAANVPLILMNPACNLRECPPFKAEHRTGLSIENRQRWERLWDEARANYGGRHRAAIELLQQALRMDDQHAGVHYDLAKCFDALGEFEAARAAYVRAKELDVCPLRIQEPMNAIVEQVAHDTDTPLVDIKALFDRISRNGIPGGDWFADHVHPTIPGYQCVADEIANELARLGLVQPLPDWESQKQRRYFQHLQSLPPLYFGRGQQRLEALMNWARGRSTREPPRKARSN